MARISTPSDSGEKPTIEQDKVASFFEARARRIRELGPVKAVIYQDKHPTLADERDQAEKAEVLPLLDLVPGIRLLDVACGTGRWYPTLRDHVTYYHGVDASEGLLSYARETFGEGPDRHFTVCRADSLSLDALGESSGFERTLCAGLLIYLNDKDVLKTLHAFARCAAPSARIVLREPTGIDARLSLVDHYSDDLEAAYNSIYRTADELRAAFAEVLEPAGFRLSMERDLFEGGALNNRAETRQRLYVLDRGR